MERDTYKFVKKLAKLNAFDQKEKIGKLIRRSNETINHYLTKALVTYLAEKKGYKVITEAKIGNYIYDIILYDPKKNDITAIEIYETHKVEEQKSADTQFGILEFKAIDFSSVKSSDIFKFF